MKRANYYRSEITLQRLKSARAGYIFTDAQRKKMSETHKRKGSGKWMKGRKEELSHSWKGDLVGYGGLHNWVKKELGRPIRCDICGSLNKKRYEWASKNHSYKRDLTEWLRLCTKCHRHYDANRLDILNKL